MSPISAVPFFKECFEIIWDFTKLGRLLAKRIAEEKTIIRLSHPVRNQSIVRIGEVAKILGLVSDYVKKLANNAKLVPVQSTNYYFTDDLIKALDAHYLTPGVARTNNYEEEVRASKNCEKIKLSEALFVTRAYEASSTKILDFIPKNLSVTTYDKWLGSIGRKYNLKDSLGNLVDINSHQFRHFLDTQFYIGGMTDVEIARMFGRKDIKQSRDYKHLSQREKREFLYSDIRDGKSVGLISDTYDEIKLISYQQAEEFLRSAIEAVHFTDLQNMALVLSAGHDSRVRMICPVYLEKTVLHVGVLSSIKVMKERSLECRKNCERKK